MIFLKYFIFKFDLRLNANSNNINPFIYINLYTNIQTRTYT